MNKIKSVSCFFRIFFQLNFFILPLLLILYWINAPGSLHILANTIVINWMPHGYLTPPSFPEIDTLSTTAKILGFFICMIPTGFYLLICYFLVKLFTLFERSEIFSFNNVKYIRNIAFLLLFGQLIGQPIYQALLSVMLTWNSHPRFMTISFDQTNFGLLLISLLMILISWIMAEGYKLREEQKYII